MKESSVVQGFLEEGRLDEARQLLLRLGERHLGKPALSVISHLESLADRPVIESMIDRIRDVTSWNELIAARR